LLESLAEMWREVEAGGQAQMKTRALVRLACAQAARAAAQAVDLMWDAGGASANFESSPLERCLRDLRAATQHIAVAPNNFVLGGRVLLGLPPGTPRF
jgi:alkylation response protein AidB-like acyl-CoA dehydrogenase